MDDFSRIYVDHHRDVYRFALFLTRDAAAAEDLAADTFVRAWAARDRIRQSTIRAYLLTIARNLHRDRLRTHGRLVPLDATFPDTGPAPDVHIQQSSSLRNARRILRRIARGDRRAFLLFVVREMSYAEVASALGISLAATKSRIFRARAALAAAFGLSDKREPL